MKSAIVFFKYFDSRFLIIRIDRINAYFVYRYLKCLSQYFRGESDAFNLFVCCFEFFSNLYTFYKKNNIRLYRSSCCDN